MSIKIMTHIWEHSTHAGSELLMLLAIADHANDEGLAWPSIPTLAKKVRVSPRQAIKLIQVLERDGSIAVEHGRGRHRTSHYHVKGEPKCTFSEKVNSSAPFEPEKVNSSAPFEPEKVNSSAQKGELASSPKPSLTVIKEERQIESGPERPDTDVMASPIFLSAIASAKPGKPAPICDREWPGLRQVLMDCDLPIAAVDDNDWWNALSYACNNPPMGWIARQCGRMRAWCLENPGKCDRTDQQWKIFVRNWLETAYREEREPHVSKKRA